MFIIRSFNYYSFGKICDLVKYRSISYYLKRKKEPQNLLTNRMKAKGKTEGLLDNNCGSAMLLLTGLLFISASVLLPSLATQSIQLKTAINALENMVSSERSLKALALNIVQAIETANGLNFTAGELCPGGTKKVSFTNVVPNSKKSASGVPLVAITEKLDACLPKYLLCSTSSSSISMCLDEKLIGKRDTFSNNNEFIVDLDLKQKSWPRSLVESADLNKRLKGKISENFLFSPTQGASASLKQINKVFSSINLIDSAEATPLVLSGSQHSTQSKGKKNIKEISLAMKAVTCPSWNSDCIRKCGVNVQCVTIRLCPPTKNRNCNSKSNDDYYTQKIGFLYGHKRIKNVDKFFISNSGHTLVGEGEDGVVRYWGLSRMQYGGSEFFQQVYSSNSITYIAPGTTPYPVPLAVIPLLEDIGKLSNFKQSGYNTCALQNGGIACFGFPKFELWTVDPIFYRDRTTDLALNSSLLKNYLGKAINASKPASLIAETRSGPKVNIIDFDISKTSMCYVSIDGTVKCIGFKGLGLMGRGDPLTQEKEFRSYSDRAKRGIGREGKTSNESLMNTYIPKNVGENVVLSAQEVADTGAMDCPSRYRDSTGSIKMARSVHMSKNTFTGTTSAGISTAISCYGVGGNNSFAKIQDTNDPRSHLQSICAQMTDRGVCCWGGNYGGQITGRASAPVSKPALTFGPELKIVKLAMAANVICGLTGGGGIVCKGRPLGNGLGTAYKPTPYVADTIQSLTVVAPDGSDIKDLLAHNVGAFVFLKYDGTVYGFGLQSKISDNSDKPWNTHLMPPAGTKNTFTFMPTQLNFNNSISAITIESTGSYVLCGLSFSGKAYCGGGKSALSNVTVSPKIILGQSSKSHFSSSSVQFKEMMPIQ